MAIIKTDKLSKVFITSTGSINAVKDISLSVKAGEIYGFLGPNGAGKTTTLRMLCTLMQPTGGTAFVAEYNLITQQDKVRESIGYVSQIGGLIENLSGRENLVFQGRFYGMSKKKSQERAQELIQFFELELFIDRLVQTYSGGQKRRVELAVGIMHKPKLLFLDEPTLGLDSQSRMHLWQQVKLLQKQGTTIFLTTHYLEEADTICDRIGIIDQGTIIIEGTPQKLKQQIAQDTITVAINPEQVEQAYTLLKLEPYVEAIDKHDSELKIGVAESEEIVLLVLRTLDAAGITIKTISQSRPTLDDVFLYYTGRSLREK
ncbi:ATP-binding cassette domain-containing protein [Candidatus Dependentiae bacterium]|nr:ATP-binding cassette domain-containing protein [Candidatus Dependentiae bacterium]